MAPQQPPRIALSAFGQSLNFQPSPLEFLAFGLTNVFAEKNNKTLRETLAHRRYASLQRVASDQYPSFMDHPLGSFLSVLKSNGDPFYRRFLNPYGDSVFCHFRMANTDHKRLKGLYAYCLGAMLMYVGRSFDPFSKRVDQGYGKIHPKNCYIDGQSTNCHLNSLIQHNHSSVRFAVCPMNADVLIERTERELIQTLRPSWNIALAR